mgnify:CR=1 FL=1
MRLDRMEAQRALKASEERHRGMFDHFPLGVYRCTQQGKFLDANPALVRILGYPDQANLEGVLAPSFYVGPEHVETFTDRLKEFGIVRGFETSLQGVDGRQIRVRNTARIHRDVDGDVAYVEGIIEDVSRAGPAPGLHQEAARYRAIYENGRFGLLTVYFSGTIRDGNPAFRALSGYHEEDLSTVEFAELFEQGDRAAVLEEIQQLAAGTTARTEGARDLRVKDGSNRTIRTQSVLIRGLEGEPDHIFIVLEVTQAD